MTPTHSPRSVQRGGALFTQFPALSPALTGIAAGIFAALIWATYLVFAKSGTGVGLMPQDFVLLRFGTAAAIMLPWLLRNDPRTLAGIGWRRAIILTVLAGLPFILLGTGGYVFAPLAHGAVIQPSTITLVSMFAAAFLLKERLTADKLIGVALIIAGLAVIASHASAMGGGHVWIGDLLFTAAGLSWTGFTILIKRWQLGAFAVTAAVSTVSAIIVVPAMLVFGDIGRIAALSTTALIAQLVVQGVYESDVYGNAKAGTLLIDCSTIDVATAKSLADGAAKAGLFPAIVPPATLIVGTVLIGAMPTVFEWTGAALATLGLMTAIGLIRSLFRPTRTLILAKG